MERPVEKGAGRNDEPQMTTSLFIFWILPVLLLAIFSRFAVNTEIPSLTIPQSRSNPMKQKTQGRTKAVKPTRAPTKMPLATDRHALKTSSSSPSVSEQSPEKLSQLPTSYQESVEIIQSRRRNYKLGSSSKPQKRRQQQTKGQHHARGSSTDTKRTKLMKRINLLRQNARSDPSDLFKALAYADSLRYYELQYHEGGTYEQEAIDAFQTIVHMGVQHRQALIDAGERTVGVTPVSDDVTLEYGEKSADGLLCAIYCAQGKVYYMANMFELAVQSYSECLAFAPEYLDALNARGSANIILGNYEQAAADFMTVIKKDSRRLFSDAFTGLARLLEANEDVIPEGWDGMIPIVSNLIPVLEGQINSNPQAKHAIVGILNRLHHVMFTYHDASTKDYKEGWDHLSASFRHKMSLLPEWNKGSELQKIRQTMQIFTHGFWPPNIGSPTKTPIFIIGFVRSGSTLLERVLDAHPAIVGTGENSVFNGRLDDIRNKIVQASARSDQSRLGVVTKDLGDEVVDEMKRRWQALESYTQRDDNGKNPQRFVDKMLTNYYNVGFIHMLYPNALILHVARNPMDTLFSAYKHEFPPGTLDYTSEFEALAELYESYRLVIEHWDQVLPGRVTHVRYEDMVHDLPGTARAIIIATGLDWDDSVLDFHKKKHAVNTLSTTQVRKGVYKDSLKAWMRYEKQLQPLVDLVGDRVEYNLKTSLTLPSREGAETRDRSVKTEL
jgi:tetratricopeptide (TPR) repeat protein